VRPELPALRHVVSVGGGDGVDADYESALAAASGAADFSERSDDDHYLLYTGGTTGHPKGTVWRHADILHAALQGGRPAGEPITRADEVLDNLAHPPGVFLVTAPLMHASGQWATLIGLLTGACIVLLDGGFDAEHLWTVVEREGVQIVNLVGDAMVRPAIDALAAEPERWDVSTVFVLSSGGAVLSPSVKTEVARRLPGALVIDGFGASETGNNGRALGVGDDGRSHFQIDAWTAVLDDELRPVEPGSGIVGRLAKRGPIPLGYYQDEQKTAETFVEVDGVRWVIPGDHATIEADGTVVVLGRGSVSINTGGEKVFPEEVEAAVKSHPAIYDAVVVGVPDDRWGEAVTAVASLRSGASVTLEELVDQLRGELAGYKLPRHLVVVDVVTRTATGKPDYPWARAAAIEVVTAAPDP
jgi:fatty-acyl-CoA synthase